MDSVNFRKFGYSLVLSAWLLSSTASQAAVNFVFNYTDPAGVGFNATGQTGIDRQAGLDAAAGIVEDLLTGYTATVHLDVNGSVTDNNTLAAASSNFNAPPASGFGNQGDVQIIILGGADPNAGVADGSVVWNFEDFQWETANDFQPGELDMISTAAHELLHAIGFSSDIAQNGNDPFGNIPGTPGMWAPFDEFMADSSGAIINPTTFVLDGAAWSAASVGGTGTEPATAGLYFAGPNTMAANGGNPVALYSPTTWSDGSSGSHLDTDLYTGSSAYLMNHAPAVSEGLDIRTVSAVERGMLRDIGYSLIAIPEPSTLAYLGLVSLVFFAHGRKRVRSN